MSAIHHYRIYNIIIQHLYVMLPGKFTLPNMYNFIFKILKQIPNIPIKILLNDGNMENTQNLFLLVEFINN